MVVFCSAVQESHWLLCAKVSTMRRFQNRICSPPSQQKEYIYIYNDVKEKRSEGLASFIEIIISDSNESMKSNQGSFFNNLSKK